MLPTHRPPLHPGACLERLFLEPLAISVPEIAERTKLPVDHIQALIQGDIECSVDTAVRLAFELKTLPSLFLDLQVRYDIWFMQERDVAN